MGIFTCYPGNTIRSRDREPRGIRRTFCKLRNPGLELSSPFGIFKKNAELKQNSDNDENVFIPCVLS